MTISRRALLKGLGRIAVALPLLPSLRALSLFSFAMSSNVFAPGTLK